MTKRLLIVACAFMLGGCALPLPLQIASWAVDGLLFVSTEKTMADHGVSIALQRDCAMLRAVTEGAYCRDDVGVAAVAVLDLPQPENDGAETAATMVDAGKVVASVAEINAKETNAALELASFETAAGDIHEDSENAPFNGIGIADAWWNAIIAAPSFFDDPAESTTIESKRQWLPEEALEQQPIIPPYEWEPELANDDRPSKGAEDEFLSHGDYPLNLGDVFHDFPPFVLADVALMGKVDRDSLYGSPGGMGDTRDPPRIAAPMAGLGGPSHHARRRRPATRSGGSSGRGPPSSPNRRSRLVRSRGSRI